MQSLRAQVRTAQRLRVRFSRGEELKYISHLDLMRLWQRALNRAGVTLAYSEGFNPHPRLSLAVPLAVGVTSEAELMDIVLARWISPHSFGEAVSRQLPRGIGILQVYQMALTMPSLQSQVRVAEYEVKLETRRERNDIDSDIAALLIKEKLPWQHVRDTGVHRYDLRVLIDDIWVIDYQRGRCVLGMSLRCDNSGAGRPEQVTAALGFEEHPASIHRTRLVLSAA